MKGAKGQVFLGLFFLLWAANCIFCHHITNQFLQARREVVALRAAGFDPESDPEIRRRLGRSSVLIITNVPLMIGLFVIAQDPLASVGLPYWFLLFAGSIYIPALLTLLFFFLLHPPGRPGAFPGEELDDDSRDDQELDDLDDDEDDEPRKR